MGSHLSHHQRRNGPSPYQLGGLSGHDVRARITTKGGASLDSVFPGAETGPMAVLLKDRGVVFPYTPTIMTAMNATYGDHRPIHSNFQYKFFQNYSLQDITITCAFTAHTTTEGLYMAGVLHFFKSAMKMGFGADDEFRGVPPPVLEFSAWGPAWHEKVPVVISNVTHNIDGQTDYVWPSSEDIDANSSMMPLKTDFIIQMSPTYSTRSTRKEYSSKEFYNGNLLRKGYI
jgi:hypothetical protein